MNAPKLGEMAEFKVYGKVIALGLASVIGSEKVETCTIELRTVNDSYLSLVTVPLSSYLPMEMPHETDS